MDCVFEVVEIQPGMFRHTCSRCGATYTVPASSLRANCRELPAALPDGVKGCGDYLHDALIKWVGESPTAECKCKDRIAQMNQWGAEICRKQLPTIVGWLKEEAQKRGWGLLLKVPVIPDLVIQKLVSGAIDQAEKALVAALAKAPKPNES